MITHTTDEDEAPVAGDQPSAMERLFDACRAFRARQAEQARLKAIALAEEKARLAVAKSNRKFEQVEEMKYYLTQRHRAAVGVWHSTPKGRQIDRQYFATMDALAAIDHSGQSVEQKLEHQRIALEYGKQAIKDVIAGRVRLED